MTRLKQSRPRFTRVVLYGLAAAEPPDAPAADATMVPVATSSGTSVASQGPRPRARHVARVRIAHHVCSVCVAWEACVSRAMRDARTMGEAEARDVLAPKRFKVNARAYLATPAKTVNRVCMLRQKSTIYTCIS